MDLDRRATGADLVMLARRARTIEAAKALDGPVALFDRLSDTIVPPRLHGVLQGEWFGHALHPLLTDFPLGSWMSVSLLDLFGGRRSRPAATGLLAFGVAATVPTVATGIAEWKAADHVSRRVGVVHAVTNGAATSFYVGSLVARLRGRHRRGVALALAGGGLAWIGGYLGGHLSIARKVGTADRSYVSRRDPMPDTEHDAVKFLLTQHAEVRSLFTSVSAASGEARREAFAPLVRLLAVHETAEEMVVYPAVRNAGEEGDRIADARLVEEDEAKKLLADLEKLDPASPEFTEPFRQFRAAVEAHAEREEREVFPLLQRTVDDEQLGRMASSLQVAESVAPTHPHRLAPESAVGNMVAGPFVAIVDRVRDAIKGAAR